MRNKETRQQRRAWERREVKHAADQDALWDRPITIEEANIWARRYGYRFAGWIDPTTVPELQASHETVVFTVPGPRFLAVFVPEPDDGGPVFYADGRTRNRAIRRGLEIVRTKIGGAP